MQRQYDKKGLLVFLDADNCFFNAVFAAVSKKIIALHHADIQNLASNPDVATKSGEPILSAIIASVPTMAAEYRDRFLRERMPHGDVAETHEYGDVLAALYSRKGTLTKDEKIQAIKRYYFQLIKSINHPLAIALINKIIIESNPLLLTYIKTRLETGLYDDLIFVSTSLRQSCHLERGNMQVKGTPAFALTLADFVEEFRKTIPSCAPTIKSPKHSPKIFLRKSSTSPSNVPTIACHYHPILMADIINGMEAGDSFRKMQETMSHTSALTQPQVLADHSKFTTYYAFMQYFAMQYPGKKLDVFGVDDSEVILRGFFEVVNRNPVFIPKGIQWTGILYDGLAIQPCEQVYGSGLTDSLYSETIRKLLDNSVVEVASGGKRIEVTTALLSDNGERVNELKKIRSQHYHSPIPDEPVSARAIRRAGLLSSSTPPLAVTSRESIVASLSAAAAAASPVSAPSAAASPRIHSPATLLSTSPSQSIAAFVEECREEARQTLRNF